MAKTVFQRIIDRELPARIEHEDEHCIVLHDLHPQAPIHLLVIPKRLIERVGAAQPEDAPLLGHLLLVAARVARQEGLEAWRTVFNSGAEAGQTVFHLHVHVIGGRPLAWPPG